jgi:hypothetical protein
VAIKNHEFIGYDLGHGETAVGRAYGTSSREPELLEYNGEKSFVSAVALEKSGRKSTVRIGAQAVNLAAFQNDDRKSDNKIWLKFKSRNMDETSMREPTRIFTKTLFEQLVADKKIKGLSTSHFVVGCPSGWHAKDRDAYADLMRASGLKNVSILPESRAALMTALEQGYLSLEAARSSVLIVDIGSSTTDFTYCVDLNAEDVGHNILGSGLLDTLIFDRNLARQKERKKIEKLINHYPHYRPVMEYWCRLVKEQYFNGDEAPVEVIRRLPVAGGILFEIRMDKEDAKAVLEAPIKELNGFSWPDTFSYALKEAMQRVEGRDVQTVLLTGGASRLPLVLPACEKKFPNANVVRGAEPEFAIARGLAWYGRFEYLQASFLTAVGELVREGGPVHEEAAQASAKLGAILAPVLVDALIENCVLPAFADWRSGKVEKLSDVEKSLDERVSSWLGSDAPAPILRPVIEDWFAQLQRGIEAVTDPMCREHGMPAMVLSLDNSTHIAEHLEGLTVAAPHVASLESDTALAGTTVSALVIGVLLAKAQLLAPLLANPIGIAVGSVLGIGGFFFGKKALEGKMRAANVPRFLRPLLTDRRVRKAAKSQRAELIKVVAEAWDEEASSRFAGDLITSLETTFVQRTHERAVLFMV